MRDSAVENARMSTFLVPRKNLSIGTFVALHEDPVARMECWSSYSPEPMTLLQPALNDKYFIWPNC